MGPEGVEVVPYPAKKYGMSAEQVERNQQSIAERGKAVGFEFRMERRSHCTWNTFDAHRLLHWAGDWAPRSARSSMRCLGPLHRGREPGAREVLLRCAAQAGLDATRAAGWSTATNTPMPCEREQLYQQLRHQLGALPVIVNERYLIQGGQPPELFEQSLREIAAEAGMRVLIVEDDPQLGDALATGLRQLQHVVDWFRDGARADAALQACPTTPWCSTSACLAATACAGCASGAAPGATCRCSSHRARQRGRPRRRAGCRRRLPRQAHHHRRARRAAACFKPARSTGRAQERVAPRRARLRPAGQACAGTTSRWS